MNDKPTSEPELPNLLATWRGQPTRTELQQLEARMTALQQLLDQVLSRPQPEFEPLRQSLDRLTRRLDSEPQLQRLEQTGKNAAELALALEATTRRLADLTAALHAQRLHHESRRRLLLWLPIAALAMSLAGNCLTVWLAWDSNQTILARLELESPSRGLGEPPRPEGRLDREPKRSDPAAERTARKRAGGRAASEPGTIDQAVAAAGAEVDPRKRADLLDQIAARAEALDAVIKETDGLAAKLIRDRQAIGECRRQADQAAQALRDQLAQAYADPAAAEAAWARLAGERGIAGAVASVTRDPAALGALKGRRRFFGLLADRERADAIAAARHVPEAGSRAWDRAIARDLDRAATFKLDSLEAGPS
ncbi:MAG: hypothetical protein WDN69_22880 [Aliidongia sp.]